MTTFGWDQSHYDAPMTVRDGIDFVTHKCAEGHHFYKDSEYRTALNSARALGVPVLGAYYVNHPGTIADQVDWFVSIVNDETPWWRDVPWMWQIDAEKFPYMDRAPTIAEVNAFGDLLAARTGSPASAIFAYAPTWLYGAGIKNLKYPVWSSNYGTNPTTGYRSAYPGDNSSRWIPKTSSGTPIGVTPVVLQYGSNTTIGNQTTCDANAYRGTVAQLIASISKPAELPEGYTMRYKFINYADLPDGIGDRIHVTDGVRYRVMQKGNVWTDLATSGGAGPITLVDGKVTGGAYAVAVATLCGKLDEGEQSTDIDEDALAASIANKLADDVDFINSIAAGVAGKLPKPPTAGTWNATI